MVVVQNSLDMTVFDSDAALLQGQVRGCVNRWDNKQVQCACVWRLRVKVKCVRGGV
jgi:hypothetical protein